MCYGYYTKLNSTRELLEILRPQLAHQDRALRLAVGPAKDAVTIAIACTHSVCGLAKRWRFHRKLGVHLSDKNVFVNAGFSCPYGVCNL